jgi:hypothetical protein
MSALSDELLLQIAQAIIDKNCDIVAASIDLSSVFDLVDIDLWLPSNLIDLISVWLTNRLFYVSIDGSNSTFLTYY